MSEFDKTQYSDIVQDILNRDDKDRLNQNFNGLEDVEKAFIMRFPSLYCLKYKPIKRKPLTFISNKVAQKHRPWQVQILDDTHPNKCVEKSRQLGLSEVAISEFIWFLDTHQDTKGMYTFPRDNQMKDFSNTRVTPLFQESEYLKGLLSKDANNVALKKLGSSYLFMRSAWGSALGEGADLDILGFDEYDRMKDNVEFAFQEGLKSSRYGWMRRWSTPSIPGRGINKLFDQSDQMRYIWTCEHCGHKQFLTLEDNVIQVNPKGVNHISQEVVPGTFIIGCKKCKKELNRWGTGDWVAMNPGRKDTRGYHISQLDSVWITADDIMKRQFTYPSKQLFYNYVVGQPYAASGLIINDQDIRDSIRNSNPVLSRSDKYPLIVAGIDWGSINWMVILGITSNGDMDLLDVYWANDNPIKPLEPVGYFASILRAYNPNLIIADAGYGADRNSFMFTQFPQSFYSCQWLTMKNSESRVKFIDQWSDKTHEVVVDKTSKMQRMLHKVKGRLVGLFTIDDKVAMLAKHLKNVRIMDEEDDGQIFQIATRIGPDHLACCLSYALIGADRLTGMGTTGTFEYDFL